MLSVAQKYVNKGIIIHVYDPQYLSVTDKDLAWPMHNILPQGNSCLLSSKWNYRHEFLQMTQQVYLWVS